MAKQAVALRLLPETLARVDALAKVRGSSRQVVLEAAVDSFLDDSERGVPDLPAPDSPPAVRAVSGVVRASSLVPMSPLAMERQRKLNEAAARARLGAPKARAKR